MGDECFWKFIEDLLIAAAVDGLLFAVNQDEKPIGFVSAAIYRADEMEGYSDAWARGARIAETKFPVVDECSRGQGIGSAIPAAIERKVSMPGQMIILSVRWHKTLIPSASMNQRGFNPPG
ncbi:hypothetical protein [Phaeobacter sp. C3_T13_0]|uniref:hypothetical protein n=1 Tax=Phaeobacter cretensis TaxID=3342641 RepID=UPI0039BCF5F5